MTNRGTSLLICLASWLLFVGNGWTQQPVDPQLAFQRIFIFEEDLANPKVLTNDYTPIELDKFKRLLINQSTEGGSGSIKQVLQLQRSTYVASLNGDTLLSEFGLSQFRIFHQGEMPSQLTLAPLSIAIRSRIESTSQTEAPNITRLPTAPFLSFAPDGSARLKIDQSVTYGFEWSQRGQRILNGTALRYAIDIPESVQCRMLLRLPSACRIIDSTGIALPMERADDLLPEVDDSATAIVRVEGDNWWMLELGGMSHVEFSLVFDQNGPRAKYRHLIKSQQLDYRFLASGLELNCELILERENSRDILLEIPMDRDLRVRDVRWGDKSIQWDAIEDGIRVALPAATDDVTLKLHCAAEWPSQQPVGNGLTNDPMVGVSIENTATVSNENMNAAFAKYFLPSLGVRDSYVLRGLGTIQVSNDWSVSFIESEKCRITQPQRPTSSNGERKWSIEWSDQSPIVALNAALMTNRMKADLLTHLSAQSDQVIANCKIRIEVDSTPRSSVILRMQPEWVFDKIECEDADINVSYKRDKQGIQALIAFSAPVTSQELFLDVQTHRDWGNTTLGRWVLNADTLVEVVAADQTGALLVRPSGGLYLLPSPAVLRSRIKSDDLAEWMQSFVPSSTNDWVIRPIDGVLPELSFEKRPSDYSSTASMFVQRTSQGASARYRIRVKPVTGSVQTIRLGLSRDPSRMPVWRYMHRGKIISLEATSLAMAPDESRNANSLWEITIPQPVTQPIEIEGELDFIGDSWMDIHLVSVPESIRQEATIEIDDSLECHFEHEAVSFVSATEFSGTLSTNTTCIRYEPTRSSLIQVRPKPSLESRRAWIVSQRVDHQLLSNGQQRHQIVWDVFHAGYRSIDLVIPKDWELVRARANDAPVQVRQGDDAENVRQLSIYGFDREPNSVALELTFVGGRWSNESDHAFVAYEPLVTLPIRQKIQFLWLPNGIRVAPTLGSANAALIDYDVTKPWNWWRVLAPQWLDGQQSDSRLANQNDSSPFEIVAPEEFALPGSWQAYLIPTSVIPKLTSGGSLDKVPTTSSHLEVHDVSRNVSLDSSDIPQSTVRLSIAQQSQAQAWCWLLGMLSLGFWIGNRIPVAALLVALISGLLTPWGMLWLTDCFPLIPLGLTLGCCGALSRCWTRGQIRQVALASETRSPGVQSDSNTHSIVSLWIVICLVLPEFVGSAAFGQVTSNLQPMTTVATDETLLDALRPTLPAIVIPIDHRGELAGQYIYVPDRLLDRLRREPIQSNELDVAYDILSARYRLQLAQSSGQAEELTLTLDLRINRLDEPFRWPLAITQARFVKFIVDNIDVPSNRLHRDDIMLEWQPDRLGRTQIRLVLQPIASHASNGIDALHLDIVPVATAQLDVQFNGIEPVEIRSTGQVDTVSAGRIRAMLGPVRQLEVNWQAHRDSDVYRLDPQLAVYTCMILRDGSPLAHSRLEIQNWPPGKRELEIECSNDWQPLGTVWGDAKLVGFAPGGQSTQRRYRLEVDVQNGSPQNDLIVIDTLWRTDAGLSNTLNVPLVDLVGRRPLTRSIAQASNGRSLWQLMGVEQWETVKNPRRVRRWPDASVPQPETVYRVPENAGPIRLRRLVSNGYPQVRCRSEIQFHTDSCSVQFEAVWNTGNNLDPTLRLILPESMILESVLVNGLPTNFLQNSQLPLIMVRDNIAQVFLNPSQARPQKVTARGRIPHPSKTWLALPLIRIADHESIEHHVIGERESEITVDFEGLEQTTNRSVPPSKIDTGRLLSRLHSAALDIELSPSLLNPSENDDASRYPRYFVAATTDRLTGKLLSKLVRDESHWRLEIESRLRRGSAKVDTVVLEIPSSIAETADVSCPSYRVQSPENGQTLLYLSPTPLTDESCTFRITARLPTDTDQPVNYPDVRLLDSDWIQRFLAVPTMVDGQTANWNVSGVRLLDANENLEVDEPWMNLAGMSVFETTGNRILLSLNGFTSRDQRSSIPAVFHQVSLSGLDQWTNVSTFWILPANQRSIDLVIPQHHELLALIRNGTTISMARSPGERIPILLQPSDLPLQLTVVTQAVLIDRINGDSLKVEVPFFHNLSIERTYWLLDNAATRQGWQMEVESGIEQMDQSNWSLDALNAAITSLETAVTTVQTRSLVEQRAWYRAWRPSLRSLLQNSQTERKLAMREPNPSTKNGPLGIANSVKSTQGKFDALESRLSLLDLKVLPNSEPTRIDPFDPTNRDWSWNSLAGSFGLQGQYAISNVPIDRIQLRRSHSFYFGSLIVLSCIATVTCLAIVLGIRFGNFGRTWPSAHPTWMLFAIGITVSILSPWKWLGGIWLLVAVISELQSYRLARQQAKQIARIQRLSMNVMK